ncbi:MAG: aspartyl-tRNA(Asn)/glutamyl-tRNA(Gln) amidotransferase subunit C [Rickettsiales bacterium]|jgi:aspartyl-tRNA(Asn)/glutamyl-tRNA(Gln) amidotransferase subunit C
MSLTPKEVTKIARLSKIEVLDENKPEIAKKLSKILDWVEILNEVDTKNVEPLLNVHQIAMTMAKDIVSDGAIADEILKNAPDAKYGYFTVPKVIE